MADMEGCLPGGTRPNTPHHHMGLSLQATVQMRLCRGCAQGGVWWKRGGGRAGARQGRTAQNSGRMFVFAATLVPRRRDIRHGNVGERENLNPGNHRAVNSKLMNRIHDRQYDPKMHFFRSNRHFETCAPSSFRKYFATHNSVKLCPEELKSTFNYCDMPSQIRSKEPRLSRFFGSKSNVWAYSVT